MELSSHSNRSGFVVLLDENAVKLRQILLGNLGPPFDRATFKEYIKGELCIENYLFWEDVESAKANGLDILTARALYSTYIVDNSQHWVNLSSELRVHIDSSMAKLSELSDDSSLPHALYIEISGVFEDAQSEVFRLMSTNTFPRFLAALTVRKNLVLARETAMWWRTRPSLREFLTFPSPMNEAEVRPKNIINAALALLHVALDYFYGFQGVAIFLIYGFAARCLAGPRLCPTALLVLFVLRPLVVRFRLLKDHFVPAPPKRFAQAVALLFTCFAFALRVLLPPQQAWVSYAVWGVFAAVASIAGFADFCIACWLFGFMVSHRLLSREVCEECAVNYMTSHNLSRPGDGATGGAGDAVCITADGAKLSVAGLGGVRVSPGGSTPHTPRVEAWSPHPSHTVQPSAGAHDEVAVAIQLLPPHTPPTSSTTGDMV